MEGDPAFLAPGAQPLQASQGRGSAVACPLVGLVEALEKDAAAA